MKQRMWWPRLTTVKSYQISDSRQVSDLANFLTLVVKVGHSVEELLLIFT